MNRTHRLVLGALALAVPLAILYGGPVNPPAGPIASTNKTLTEVEPRTQLNASTAPGDVASVHIISQPGSYYLTADVRPTGGRNAILVTADHVTIDLNGFALDGSSDTTGFRAGITNATPRRNLVVRNGTIRGFRGYGMIGQFHNSSFENLTFIDSLSGQLEIAQSSGCTIRNVRARATSGETGIQVGTNCVIEHCTTEGATVGITILSGTVRGCSVLNPGANGISIGSGVVSNCYVEGANNTSSLTNAGINAGNAVHLEGCTVRSCAASGVYLGQSSEIVGCQLVSCAKGVNGGGRNRVENCQIHFSSIAAITLSASMNFIVGNRFHQNAVNIANPGTNTIGEVLDFSAGGTLTGANAHSLANIIY